MRQLKDQPDQTRMKKGYPAGHRGRSLPRGEKRGLGKLAGRSAATAVPSCRSEAAEAVAAPSAVAFLGSLPHPRARPPALGVDSALIRKVGVPPGSPRARPARSLARACGAGARGPGLRAGREGGGVGGWRGAPPPIAGPRCGLLTWRAERCCNHGQRPEVRAKCKGLLHREALPQAPLPSARGDRLSQCLWRGATTTVVGVLPAILMCSPGCELHENQDFACHVH
uniref:uncharacterized protein LOC132663410 n=1 Tax=Panthera onca TaxID=9690 RepID=UPI0029551BDD|nr:uncharacterized protein LOC132663410 [Panthera onca]